EYQRAVASVRQIDAERAADLTKRVIRIYAIGIEKRHLKDLYHYDEVNERVYKRVMHKLSLQLEALEQGKIDADTIIHTKGGDLLDRFVAAISEHLKPLSMAEK